MHCKKMALFALLALIPSAPAFAANEPTPKQAEAPDVQTPTPTYTPPPVTPPPVTPPPVTPVPDTPPVTPVINPGGTRDCSLTDLDSTLNSAANNCVGRLCPLDPSDPSIEFSPLRDLIHVCQARNCCKYCASGCDINNDGVVDVTDVEVIKQFVDLSMTTGGVNPADYLAQRICLDPNGDGYSTPRDVLYVINCLPRTPPPTPHPQYCCWGPTQGYRCLTQPLPQPYRRGEGCNLVSDCSSCIPPTPTPTLPPQNQRCIWTAAWANCSGYLMQNFGTGVFGCPDAPAEHRLDTAAVAAAAAVTPGNYKEIPACFAQRFADCRSNLSSAIYKGTVAQSSAVKIYGGCPGVGAEDLGEFLGVPANASDSALKQYLANRSTEPVTISVAGRTYTFPGTGPDSLWARYLAQKGINYADVEAGRVPYSKLSELFTHAVGIQCFLSSTNPVSYPGCYLPWLPSMSWYMDENCRYVRPSSRTKLCGFAGVAWSPISLLWEETTLTEDMTVVPFSINAETPAAYTLWKASGKAPLLIYDPDNTGLVKSATQLFGHYAFGGKTASLAQHKSGGLREPWDNGYEALALLDIDRDGKVSGQELQGVSLWFDRNRDGAVQEGEVKSIASAGVTVLYYRWDREEQGGDLHASIGYERLVKGKKIQGASVDWYSPTFSSKQEAVQALSAMFGSSTKGSTVRGTSPSAANSEAATQVPWAAQPLSFKPHKAHSHAEDISGFWVWMMTDQQGRNTPGVFAFEQNSEGGFIGYSVVEAELAKNAEGLKSGITTLPALGFVRREQDGRYVVSMKVKDEQGGGFAKSTATLSADGLELRGTTTQKFSAVNDKGVRESGSARYEWIAQKAVGDSTEKTK